MMVKGKDGGGSQQKGRIIVRHRLRKKKEYIDWKKN